MGGLVFWQRGYCNIVVPCRKLGVFLNRNHKTQEIIKGFSCKILFTWEVEFFWSPRCYYMMELLSNKYFILFRVTILRIQILCSFFAHEQLFTNNYLLVASHIKKNFGYSVRNNSCQKSAIFFFLSIKTKSTEVSSNEGTKRGPVGSLYQFLLTRTYRQLLRGLQVFNNKNINISL